MVVLSEESQRAYIVVQVEVRVDMLGCKIVVDEVVAVYVPVLIADYGVEWHELDAQVGHVVNGGEHTEAVARFAGNVLLRETYGNTVGVDVTAGLHVGELVHRARTVVHTRAVEQVGAALQHVDVETVDFGFSRGEAENGG